MSEWIDVNDKLPLNESDLPLSGFDCIEILSFSSGFVYMDEYQIGGLPGFWGSFQRNEVTHWQPLPEPPTED